MRTRNFLVQPGHGICSHFPRLTILGISCTVKHSPAQPWRPRPQGIKVIKFYAWESIFTDRITAKRGMQLHFLLLRKLCGAGTICLALSTPALITCTGFAFFSLWSSTPLTAGVAFSALSLFNILLLPMFTLPTTINAWINAVVSSNRILKFLLMPTMDRSFLHHDYDAATKVAVDIDGTFQWETGAPSDAPSDAAAPPPPEASSSADTDPAAPSVPRVERFEFKAQVSGACMSQWAGAVTDAMGVQTATAFHGGDALAVQNHPPSSTALDVNRQHPGTQPSPPPPLIWYMGLRQLQKFLVASELCLPSTNEVPGVCGSQMTCGIKSGTPPPHILSNA